MGKELLRYSEIIRIRRILEHVMDKKYMLYRSEDGRLYCDSFITIKCVSPYYDGSRICFRNIPKDGREWNIIERYAMLEHAMECPYPDRCPTVQESIKIYPSILKK